MLFTPSRLLARLVATGGPEMVHLLTAFIYDVGADEISCLLRIAVFRSTFIWLVHLSRFFFFLVSYPYTRFLDLSILDLVISDMFFTLCAGAKRLTGYAEWTEKIPPTANAGNFPLTISIFCLLFFFN
jgi:hypothetical protein